MRKQAKEAAVGKVIVDSGVESLLLLNPSPRMLFHYTALPSLLKISQCLVRMLQDGLEQTAENHIIVFLS